MRGSFIVLEGLDRSGKSSQAGILCEALQAQGRKVLLWKYPARETFLGQTIDGYLKNSVNLPDRSIHLLFSANRWETVDAILAELKSGTDIVCDRYAYSGIAYSAAKGLDFEWCRSPDVGLPQPDIVLYMKVSAEVARLRGGYGEERYEREEFQRKVGEWFMRLSETEGSRWKVIDADRDINTISAEVFAAVCRISKEDLLYHPYKLWTPEFKPDRLVNEKPVAEEPKKERIEFISLSAIPSHQFGFLSISSEGYSDREFANVRELTPGNELVWIRARVQALRKHGSKLVFLILREQSETVQAVVSSNAEIVKFASLLTKESVLEVYGRVTIPPEPLRQCTQSGIEIAVEKVFCISRAETVPVQFEDLEGDGVEVQIDTRLSNRVLDLRTAANQSIFRLQSAVCQLFRQFLLEKGFLEIHTPKLLASASEGGSSVFKLKYFDRFAYLAQSPQLYKQMALMADFPGVFEIGPVFRAEKSVTHRHMTEFVGLDLEVPIREHFSEVLDVMDALFDCIFTGLRANFKREIESVREQYPFEDLRWSYPCLKLEYAQAIDLLVEHGPALILQDIANIDKQLLEGKDVYIENRRSELISHLDSLRVHLRTDDMGTSDEKLLGRIIRNIHQTDFYMITKFPANLRPFYTMPCPHDPSLTNSYDIYIRGEEIVSGAQRVHDPEALMEMAKSKKVDLSPIQAYVDAFKYGAFPHGGGGVGLERVVMLFLGLPNIRLTSMFPRDPYRLTP